MRSDAALGLSPPMGDQPGARLLLRPFDRAQGRQAQDRLRPKQSRHARSPGLPRSPAATSQRQDGASSPYGATSISTRSVLLVRLFSVTLPLGFTVAMTTWSFSTR